MMALSSSSIVLSQEIFRAYDIRGDTTKNLDESIAYDIGRGFARALEGRHPKVIVARDGRLSSFSLAHALIDGLVQSGCHVIDCGEGPSPYLYFSQQLTQSDGAIMVTGSHNPSHHNGFKFVRMGRPFFGQDIQGLYHRIIDQDFQNHQGSREILHLQSEYVSLLVKDFLSHYGSQKPLNIVWDPGHGAIGYILKDVLSKLPGQHKIIHENVDGTFPARPPDPTNPDNLKALAKEIYSQKPHGGFAFDGDGDRIGVLDEKGDFIWGDRVLLLCAQEVLKNIPGSSIITDIKASQSFFRGIEQMGGKPVLWKTGHSYIKNHMQETGAKLAGEMSGHIFFADRYGGYDDGLYSALRVMGAMGAMDMSLSEWMSQYPCGFPSPEYRFSCPEKPEFYVDSLKKLMATRGVVANTLDGIRVTTNQGWWLLRGSNTEQALVARLEGNTPQDLDNLKNILAQDLKNLEIQAPW
jgi:phosphomannomutase